MPGLKLQSEASSVPGDANIRPDLCCRLGKVNHLHCSLQHILHTVCLSVCLSSLHCICIFNICICMNQDSLTSLPDLHFHYWRAKTSREESHLATLTEQLMCRAGSSQICRFCTLFETQHLAVSPPSIIPNTSHPASPLLCCIISSSPLLVHTRPRSVSCQWNDLFNT